MRCLSIAEAFRNRGEESIFILADEISRALVESHGFEVLCLYTQWNQLEAETGILIREMKSRQIRTLILDSYFVTEVYLKALRAEAKTVYIDDLNRFVYSVDLLINYNIYAEAMHYHEAYQTAGISTRFLLGCAYVPLREEFVSVRRGIRKTAQKLLITTGGTDNYNVAGELLQTFSRCSWFSDMDYYVVVGKFNKNKTALKQQWGSCKNIHLLCDVANISDYMRDCDMAVTAGGVTVYELLACGIPSVLYTLADNQVCAAETLSAAGIMPYAGDIRTQMAQSLAFMADYISSVRENAEYRSKLSGRMQKMVDGLGCERIADAILKLERNESVYETNN